jgi:hypothetical protein
LEKHGDNGRRSRIVRSTRMEHTDTPYPRRLLPAHRERPSNRRSRYAAEEAK